MSSPLPPPVLHLVCGKIGAGKSPLTQRLAASPHTVLLSEDAWLSQLYADELQTVADYVRCAGRLRNALSGHIDALLRAGLSVVLNFPANTPGTRQWAKDLFERAGGGP